MGVRIVTAPLRQPRNLLVPSVFFRVHPCPVLSD
jgi:hypothetical protein